MSVIKRESHKLRGKFKMLIFQREKQVRFLHKIYDTILYKKVII